MSDSGYGFEDILCMAYDIHADIFHLDVYEFVLSLYEHLDGE